jgi:hypothetical protein
MSNETAAAVMRSGWSTADNSKPLFRKAAIDWRLVVRG